MDIHSNWFLYSESARQSLRDWWAVAKPDDWLLVHNKLTTAAICWALFMNYIHSGPQKLCSFLWRTEVAEDRIDQVPKWLKGPIWISVYEDITYSQPKHHKSPQINTQKTIVPYSTTARHQTRFSYCWETHVTLYISWNIAYFCMTNANRLSK